MFPYNYKRKKSDSSLNLNFKNVSERVKNQYLNAYRAIVNMVCENQYEVPRSYSKSDWKKLMIELQCTAFVKLRKDISRGNLSMNEIDGDTLQYLKYDTITERARIDWHDLYVRSNQCN